VNISLTKELYDFLYGKFIEFNDTSIDFYEFILNYFYAEFVAIDDKFCLHFDDPTYATWLIMLHNK
jgi:hypothetical protein